MRFLTHICTINRDHIVYELSASLVNMMINENMSNFEATQIIFAENLHRKNLADH